MTSKKELWNGLVKKCCVFAIIVASFLSADAQGAPPPDHRHHGNDGVRLAADIVNLVETVLGVPHPPPPPPPPPGYIEPVPVYYPTPVYVAPPPKPVFVKPRRNPPRPLPPPRRPR